MEFCLSSYVIISILAGLFLWSALRLASRADRKQHDLAFWTSLERAKKAGRFPYDYDMEEEGSLQTVKGKKHLPGTIPS